MDEIANGQDLADMIGETAKDVEPEVPAFGGLIKADCQRVLDAEVGRYTTPRGIECDPRSRSGRSERLVPAGPDHREGARKVAARGNRGTDTRAQLDEYLMEAAAGESSSNGQAAPIVDQVQYEARMDPKDPDATGFYAIGEK